MIHLAPSILAADFARLGEQVAQTEEAGVHRIHVDVMDGHFVPNLSMGPVVVECLRPRTRLPLEVHLMVSEPAKFLTPFVKAGADTLIVHHEVLPDARPLLRAIRAAGKKAGLAINPDTPVHVLEPYVPDLDLALCMTVYPGFAGQKFLPQSPGRIRALRQLLDRLAPRCELEVDGGIDKTTAPLALAAGANVLVAASAIFAHPDGPTAGVKELQKIVYV
ncbi:MAG: ribulose-phosphate 3-epimerase [Gemmataceae bacterium]|nr:ribulose-phosphate 3-epimerase [Gemmataceae bacterium]